MIASHLSLHIHIIALSLPLLLLVVNSTMKSQQSQSLLFLVLLSVNVLKLTEATSFSLKRVKVAFPHSFRGGSTRVLANDDDDDEQEEEREEDPEVLKKKQVLRKYRIEQQMLMQLRSTILSEALAKRGLPMVTLMDVSTKDGDKPPEMVDWDCAMSTEDESKVSSVDFSSVHFVRTTQKMK